MPPPFGAGRTLDNLAWQPRIAFAQVGVTVVGYRSSSPPNADTDWYRPGRHAVSGLLGTS
ncbi:hypothetical protein EGK76_03375 [Luteimonas sp. 100069]|nr:hypothetical protein EGK76_03375 [Luteimonas sp. 100069]